VAVRDVNKQLLPREVDCPGGKQTCPDDNTCCKLSTESYGCCPLPDVRDFSWSLLFMLTASTSSDFTLLVMHASCL